jgi:hypothetical protein
VPQRPREKGPLFLFVSDDPERDWDVVAPHVMYTSNMNATWALERGVGATPYPPLTDIAELKARPQQFAVVTPQECIDLMSNGDPDAEYTLHPLMGGLAPEHGTASLQRFIDHVLPVLAERGVWQRPAAGSEALR